MRRWRRLTWRRLVIQYDAFLSWLIRKLGNSHRAHISIGVSGAVIDPQVGGNFWWAELHFITVYPSLLEYVEIDVSHLPSDEIVQERGRRSAIPTLVRWATRGRTKADDCLTTAIDLLHSAGVPVRSRTHTIQGLYDQLIQLPGARVVEIQPPKSVSRP